jgi:predicted nucleic acid-binding protein
MIRVALDTNVLGYVEDVNGPGRQRAATALVEALAKSAPLVPVQALGEL